MLKIFQKISLEKLSQSKCGCRDAFYIAWIKESLYDYRFACIKHDINMIKSNKKKLSELHWVYKINKLIKVKVGL